jgi:hypothetical protein
LIAIAILGAVGAMVFAVFAATSTAGTFAQVALLLLAMIFVGISVLAAWALKEDGRP